MKILLWSDQHIHSWKSFGTDEVSGISRRLKDQLNANAQIVDIAVREKIDVAICGGDVYHSRGTIPVVAMNFVNDFFDWMKSSVKNLYLVRGNHDLVSDSDYKLHYDAILPIDKARRRGQEVTLDGIKFRFVDYYENINEEKITGYDVVVLHKQPAIVNEYGYKFDGVNWKTLAKNNRLVFFGHYHAPTELSDNCFIMGSTISLNFGETGDHGVYVVDTADWGIKFYKLNYPKFITVEQPEQVVDDGNYYRVLHATKKSDKENVVNVVVPQHFDERISSLDFNEIIKDWLKINEKDESYLKALTDVIGTQQVGTERKLYKGKLIYASIRNFISIGKVDFDIKNGFTLVTGENDLGGSNGSGKSSLFDAIYWCLFGETTKGLTGDDVVRRGEKDCLVSIDLEHDNKCYSILRTRKEGLVISTYSTSHSEKHLSNLVDGMRQANRQEFLENEILGFDKTLYLTSCYFSQEQLQTLTDLSDVDRTNMVSGLLGFEIYDKLYNIIKDHLDTSKDSVTDLDEDYAELEHNINADGIHLKGVEDRIKIAKKEIKEQTEFINTTAVDEIMGDDIDFDAEEKKLTAEESEISEDQDKVEEELENIKNKIGEVSTQSSALVTKYEMFSVQKDARTEKIEEMKALKFGEKCDYCGALITKENAGEYIKLQEDALITLEESITEVNGKLKGLNEMLVKHNISKAKCYMLIEDYKRATVSVRQKIRQLSDKKREYQLKQQKAKLLQESVDKAFTKVKEYKAQLVQYDIEKINLNKDIEDKKAKMDEIDVLLAHMAEESDKLEFWKKSFSSNGLKTLLLDRFCNEYNQVANEYISAISNGEMSIVVNPTKTLKSGEERNKIGIEVHNNGTAVKYESLSGGEKKRVDIALCLALNKWVANRYGLNNGLLGILVLDEIFAFLDSLGEESIGSLLYKEGSDKAIYVISHTNELSSYANKYIVVKKVKGVSELLS